MKAKKEAAVLVILLLLGLLVPSVLAATGCFTEPSIVTRFGGCQQIDRTQALTFCRDATASVEKAQACVDTYFTEGILCSADKICARTEGTWCTDSCAQVDFAAQCADRTTWINEVAEPLACGIGCCVCDNDPLVGTDNLCDSQKPLKRESECSAFCGALDGFSVGTFDRAISALACISQCTTFTFAPAIVKGFVRDLQGNIISGVSISSLGRLASSDSLGSYELLSLPAGEIAIKAEKADYKSSLVSLTLKAGETTQQDIILQKIVTGPGTIFGSVTDGNSPILSSTVRILGPTAATSTVNSSGAFRFENLPLGTYTVSVAADGFLPVRQNTVISTSELFTSISFILSPNPVTTIRGRITDSLGNPLSAQIFINDIFTSVSASNGFYSITIQPQKDGDEFAVQASKTAYFKVNSQRIPVVIGKSHSADFVLTSIGSLDCTFPIAKPVDNFAAMGITGEKAVTLSWKTPCETIVGYTINRTALFGTLKSVKTLPFLDVVTGNLDTFVDRDVDWGTSYTYTINAVYRDGRQRLAEKKLASVTMGDKRCEGRRTSEFCESSCVKLSDILSGTQPSGDCGVTLRKVCTSDNQVVDAPGEPDCAALGKDYFCSGPDITEKTQCRRAICSSTEQQANPFGIWFTRDACYGSFDSRAKTFENFCAFDRSLTIFDSCKSCSSVKSCFDYKSEDACLLNNCIAPGTCSWTSASKGLGTGYCAPLGYNRTDHCTDCSAQSSLFFNALCSARVCDALGACYSKQGNVGCTACSAISSCSDFLSESECTGGRGANFENGVLISSMDSCSLGRCSWNTAASRCFKDGNDDKKDDCSVFADDRMLTCRKDNTPPITVVRSPILLLNLQHRQAIFDATDAQRLNQLYYCVDRTNTCIPSENKSYGSSRSISTTLPVSDYQGPGNYYLRFRSDDIFFNLENVKTKSLFADLEAPLVTVDYTVRSTGTGSLLNLSIKASEAVVCTDVLHSYDRNDDLHALLGTFGESFEAVYSDLKDGLYRYDINCTDGGGNTGFGQADLIDIDSEQFIKIMAPPSATNETTFRFMVNTSFESSCALFEAAQRREDMTTSDNFIHTSTTHTFAPNVFSRSWKARCTALATGKIREKTIPFSIDRLAPNTSVKISTSEGISALYSGSDWTARHQTNLTFSFVCMDSPSQGFGCDNTKYCVVSNGVCDPAQTGSSPVIRETSRVCYFSTDEGGNKEERKCGTISVLSGFGIALVKPRYGFSNVPLFDLAVSSRVSSDTCKWAAADFNFASLIRKENIFNTKHPYLFEKIDFTEIVPDFPDVNPTMLVSVICNSTLGRISPSQQFEIGYDPTPPVITSASAEPTIVIEGDTVDLVVATNEPTLCRYGSGTNSYIDMKGLFPGEETAEFSSTHRRTINLVGSDQGKTFFYNMSCMNQAMNYSASVQVSYTVNFSVSGLITDKGPSGVIKELNPLLFATTNKDATCQYIDNKQTLALGASGTLHTAQKNGLTNGAYSFPIQCVIVDSGLVRKDNVDFTIDTVPPVGISINDGDFACNLAKASATFNATDSLSKVTGYHYWLLEKSTGLAILNGSTKSDSLSLTRLNLSADTDYFFKMKPVDAAGNNGSEISSDGFKALGSNSTQCLEKGPPRLSITSKNDRTGVSVVITCVDETGCSTQRYGLSANASSCSPTNIYSGPISVTTSQFVCGYGEDGVGNNVSLAQSILVPDEDGDGVLDAYDKCPRTVLGETANSDGCSPSQLVIDTDSDRLPDDWEVQHDDEICSFNPRDQDSDHDGIDDAEQDYDKDGKTNFDEFKAKTDPCQNADMDNDGILDLDDACDHTSTTEILQITKTAGKFYGCGPSERDTDGDGMDDAFEQKHCAGNCDPNADLDKDELTTLEEYKIKTNPTQADSDSDGWTDGEEVAAQTDPLNMGSHPQTHTVPLLLLAMGTLFIIGGAGYLFYLGRFGIAPVLYIPEQRIHMPEPVREDKTKELVHLKEVIAKRKEQRRKLDEQRREAVFGVFGSLGVSRKEPLPALARVVSRSAPVFAKLQAVTNHYVRNKKTIDEKLNLDERNVFLQLEKVAKSARGDMKAAIGTQKDAHSIFNELNSIIKDHEKGARDEKK